MSPPVRITRHDPRTPDPLGFDALREQGIQWTQEASGKLWTDYNLHDPGVTLLEALCYALTEDVFLARQDVPALLQLGQHAPPAAWARLGLHQPHDLLPCRPLTELDWQLWLRRQLPHVRQLQMHAKLDAQGHFTGLWQLRLQAPEQTDQQAQHALRQRAMKLFWQQRNLGEDLAQPPQWLEPRWVRLRFKLMISGERDIEALLAEILQRCDDLISGRFSALSNADPETPPPDELPEGPLPDGPSEAELRWAQSQQAVLHASDIARHLADVKGLAGVDELTLEPLNPLNPQDIAHDIPLPTGSVHRYGPGWALRLHWPETLADLRDWHLFRDGSPVQMHRPTLLPYLAEQRHVMALRRNNAHATTDTDAASSAHPSHPAHPVHSRKHAHHAHTPHAEDDADPASIALPAIYRETLHQQARNEPGLKNQWTGYMALLEQGLMHVRMQRAQLPRLYDLHQEDLRSTWPNLPSDAHLPGLDALLDDPLDGTIPADFDEDRLSRRHRLLDYQLALHGEALDHSALKGLPCYFNPTAWSEHLLHLKRHFARRLLRLGKHRTGAADHSQPMLHEVADKVADNTPPLQERLALMLGMTQTHSRLLSTAPQKLLSRGLSRGGYPRPTERLDDGLDEGLNHRLQELHIDLGPLEQPLEQQAQALRTTLDRLGDDTAWLRAAVQPHAFRYASAPRTALILITPPEDLSEEETEGWVLAEDIDRPQALALALALHRFAAELQAQSEGLHVVESLLLRPMGLGRPEVAEAAEVDLWLVFSGWTARGHDPRFRRLADQRMIREAPAHLRCQTLWLSEPDMLTFEQHWSTWLDKRHAYTQALLQLDEAQPHPTEDPTGETEDLDRASATLSAWLAQAQAQAEAKLAAPSGDKT